MAQTNTWDVQISGSGESVTCYRCNGQTPESQEFPAGTVCGQGDAAAWPYFAQPSCGGNDCTNPTGAEGSEKCIDGFMHTCDAGQWVENTPQDPCGEGQCEQLQSQTECENAGCFWYAYPNPFGEPSCHGKPIYIQYLPIIVAGVGAIVVVAALLSSRKKPTQPYYYPPPPPPYYPPPGR